MSCSVKGCTSAKRFQHEGITFHRFPKGEVLEKWLQVLGIEGHWKWSDNKYVCSKHFKERDFIKLGHKTFLKPNVVPNLEVTKTPVGQNIEIASTSSQQENTTTEQISNITGDFSLTTQAPSFISTQTSSSDDAIRSGLRSNLKRHLVKSSGEETSRSTDSSTKRKRVKFIQTIHNYSVSPGKIRKKYTELRTVQRKSRRKLYSATKTIRNLKRKVNTLKTVVQDLKQKQSLSDGAIFHLEKCYEDIPHVLMSRYLKNIKNATTSRENYPEKLRNFACTLQFYSNKAYEYVRRTFALALPHQSVIRKWCANINCHPGFCDSSFDALKMKVQEATSLNRDVVCSLLLDEMAIKKQVDFDGKRFWGYVDIGVPIESDDLDIASEALVLMVVCHNSHWKLAIAYFLIKSLNGLKRANIVSEALVRLENIGIMITSVTCDGPSVHFAMLKELGCKLNDIHNIKNYFPHPARNDTKVYCLLDVCHMLKLMRNLLASLGQISTREGVVDWQFIKKLHEIQEHETLKLANKLKKSHMEWQKQKMKVDLAAQTLSASVADALEFLNVELDHPNFKGVEATASFIRRIDRLFDILNCRSPWARGYKAALRENNEESWRPFLVDTCRFLLECTDVSGRPLYCTPRKTPILGFVISSMSVMGIFDDFVKTQKLNYLLSYKCSQDHLEIFFCSVRSRNGWNNNPTCLQFMHTFRKLLLFSSISERGGNCKVLDDTIVLKVPSSTIQKAPTDRIDVSICRRYNLEVSDEAMTDHDYNVLPCFVGLNEFSATVVTYISGYVVKMLKRTYKCPECITSCVKSNDIFKDERSYRLIVKKNRGGLQIPSEGVVKLCEATEVFTRRIMIMTNNKLPNEENFMPTFVMAVAQKFYNDAEELFPSLIDHNLSFEPNEESHVYILIKKIIAAYARIRFFNLSKKYTETIQGPAIRKQLTKLILFNHQ